MERPGFTPYDVSSQRKRESECPPRVIDRASG